ncbi:thioredoxin domain-containing protein [Microbacterium koreense]|uniref:Thioredoxin domain-containing protein n=1 Tax=Microbacterium koreense TaxID=323761 RepID=A0ABW2ZQT1_9MICO
MDDRLSASASPYLRAHADNPVAWYPWGDAAFSEARRRDVPVFVSIGYSTCHWCHVMARESFSDAATAADLADGFVSIKVDREEHPDVDAAYMAAASAFTQNLGWPLSVFVTPDGKPFYAGTYFPLEPRQGMPAFRQVLAAVREAWSERRAQIDETATAVVDALADARAAAAHSSALPSTDDLAAAAAAIAEREDPEFGGFGTDGPKFPVATSLTFLQAMRAEAPGAAAVASRAFSAMADSPLRDRIDGGFFRYATRRDWTVPHYERMLIDNAQLLDVAVVEGAHDVARGIAAFLIDVLQQPEGAFGAAQDSESIVDGRRSEGGYYLVEDRTELVPPRVDGKAVTAWNGVAIAALSRAGSVLDEPTFVDAAARAADAVIGANTASDGRLVRASLGEIPSRAAATLADYGDLAGGLIALAVALGRPEPALQARELVRACLRSGGAPVVPGGGDAVLAAHGLGEPDVASDGDEPSGVAAVADAAVGLWMLGAGEEYRAFAVDVIERHATVALAQPFGHSSVLRVAARLARAPRQLVVVARDREDPLARASASVAADLVCSVTPEQADAWTAAGFSLFAGKALVDGCAAAYDCHDFTCRMPVTDAGALDH